jgi:hypothetical protein
LNRLIKVDPATRTFNMLGFHDVFDGVVALAHRRKLPLALMRIRFNLAGPAARRAGAREVSAKTLAHELLRRRRREETSGLRSRGTFVKPVARLGIGSNRACACSCGHSAALRRDQHEQPGRANDQRDRRAGD